MSFAPVRLRAICSIFPRSGSGRRRMTIRLARGVGISQLRRSLPSPSPASAALSGPAPSSPAWASLAGSCVGSVGRLSPYPPEYE
jgi:hypothetical protein